MRRRRRVGRTLPMGSDAGVSNRPDRGQAMSDHRFTIDPKGPSTSPVRSASSRMTGHAAVCGGLRTAVLLLRRARLETGRRTRLAGRSPSRHRPNRTGPGRRGRVRAGGEDSVAGCRRRRPWRGHAPGSSGGAIGPLGSGFASGLLLNAVGSGLLGSPVGAHVHAHRVGAQTAHQPGLRHTGHGGRQGDDHLPFAAGTARRRGAADVFTTSESRLLAVIRKVCHLPEAAVEGDYRSIAQGWRPLRSWVSFWLRAASPHTLDSLESGSYQHAFQEESP